MIRRAHRSASSTSNAVASVAFHTEIGLLRVAATADGVTSVEFDATEGVPQAAPATDPPATKVLRKAIDQIDQYFKGTLTHFTVPLAPAGTDFQMRVWNQLGRIPYASTTTYGALARSLGDPNATRAVGLANGRNPIPIIIPCHRVIGADGSMTGFGGGIERKKWLLEHERRVAGGPGSDDFLLFSALPL